MPDFTSFAIIAIIWIIAYLNKATVWISIRDRHFMLMILCFSANVVKRINKHLNLKFKIMRLVKLGEMLGHQNYGTQHTNMVIDST